MTSGKRPPPVSDHISLTLWVVAYGRFDCTYKVCHAKIVQKLSLVIYIFLLTSFNDLKPVFKVSYFHAFFIFIPKYAETDAKRLSLTFNIATIFCCLVSFSNYM